MRNGDDRVYIWDLWPVVKMQNMYILTRYMSTCRLDARLLIISLYPLAAPHVSILSIFGNPSTAWEAPPYRIGSKQ